ncbi:threonine--tRNA ligase [Candidatus Daviesbacteria bacterium]|nr:threonine--tRNA ligase [Candidatus Daviesbacteria bacterium]
MDSNDKDTLNNLRHSAAHLLAAAVMQLYPNAKRTIGPAIEDGFYYDFDFGETKISEEDFSKIERKMAEILPSWSGFERHELSADEAKKEYPNNEYKQELIDEFTQNGEKVTFYKSGEYWDLCKGGHVENPSKEIGAFKLLSIAGAYWRGSEKNKQSLASNAARMKAKMLTRIYGTAFPTQKELDDYLKMLEEAKRRDHRKLGKELDLFVFSDLVGAGLPLFTPKGTILRDKLFEFSESLQLAEGYQKVWIPHITKTELYKKSGHWDKFGSELFLVKSQETDDQFVLKPMNCPHHIQIYASRKRSYKDLPIRYMETTVQYRDEKAGEMLGLSRVRSISIDDAHIFVKPDQIEEEFRKIMNMVKQMYEALNMKFKARLSFRDDSDKYLGDKKDWENAQSVLEDVAKKLKINYFLAEGEAAFYGPKIDIMVTDSLGREWQCATEQLDFVQPARFGITYTDEDGKEKTPYLIHKALLGSIERFLSVYIEHTGGAFPVWLSPVQVKIIPISDKNLEYSRKVMEQLREKNIRVELDDRAETMQSKIRAAQMQKVPYMLIIGGREEEAKKVAVRKRNGEDLGALDLEEFVNKLQAEIESKS